MSMYRSGTYISILLFARFPGLFFALLLAIVLTFGVGWLEDDPSTCSWPDIPAVGVYQVCGTRAQRKAEMQALTRASCAKYNNIFSACKAAK